MKAVLAVQDRVRPVAARANLIAASTASAPELQKNELVEPGHARDQPLGQQAREQRHVQLHEARHLPCSTWSSAPTTVGWLRPQANTPKPLKQVEVAVALGVEQIGALAAHVVDVVAEDPQHADQRRVQMALEQLELVAPALGHQRLQVQRQGFPPARSWAGTRAGPSPRGTVPARRQRSTGYARIYTREAGAQRDTSSPVRAPGCKPQASGSGGRQADQEKGAKWPLRAPLESCQSIPKALQLLRVALASASFVFAGWAVLSR